MRRPPDTHGNHLRLCQVKNAARFHGCRVVVASGNGRDGCVGKLLRVHERRHQPVLLIVEAQSSLRSSDPHPHLARFRHRVSSPPQAANRTFDLQDSTVCHCAVRQRDPPLARTTPEAKNHHRRIAEGWSWDPSRGQRKPPSHS